MRLAAAILVAGVAIVGCGGGSSKSDKQQIADTVATYYNAAAAGDGSKTCDLLAKRARTQLEQRAGGRKCSDVVTAELAAPAYKKIAPALKSAKVTNVVVNGDQATASVKTSIRSLSIPLAKEGDAWKIQVAVGG
jgi:hypothetical protein